MCHRLRQPLRQLLHRHQRAEPPPPKLRLGMRPAPQVFLLLLANTKWGTRLTVLILLCLAAAAGYGIYSFLSRSGPAPFQNFTISQITTTGRALLAAISPDGRYILSVQNDSGKQSLWLRNVPTASDTQIVPPAAVSYASLMFSPDGNYIYFRKAETSVGSAFNLYRAPVLGGTPQRIVVDIDSDISFSPDGKGITYFRDNDPEVGRMRLLSANPDGGDERPFSTDQARISLLLTTLPPGRPTVGGSPFR